MLNFLVPHVRVGRGNAARLRRHQQPTEPDKHRVPDVAEPGQRLEDEAAAVHPIRKLLDHLRRYERTSV